MRTNSTNSTNSTISPSRRLVLALLCACICGCLTSTTALASGEEETKPLKITKFSFQPTEAVRTAIGEKSWGFENRPTGFTQAGGHPDALTTLLEFESEQVLNPFLEDLVPVPTRDPRDVVVDLPPGLLGNPTAMPRCPLEVALSRTEACPSATQAGIALVKIDRGDELVGPIVNVVPEAGQSAEFALENSAKFSALLTGHVIHTEGGYGLAVSSNAIAEVGLWSVEATFWGVPASPVHDPERGLFCSKNANSKGNSFPWECGASYGRLSGHGGEPSEEPEVPFLTWPSDCGAGSEQVSVRADSWEEPGVFTSASQAIPPVTGCNLLTFRAGIEVEPDTMQADAPVGLGVNLTVPQVETPQRPATPELRSAVVTLPLGMSVSPGIVDGIQACNESGPEGIDFTGPESEEIGLNGEPQLAPGHCPNASKIGTAEAVTPLLSEPVKGAIYLARPGCGGAGQSPCTEQDALDGNLYKLYLELGGTGSVLGKTGVHVKVPGEVQANPATGQLTTRFEGFPVGNPPHFDGNPQLPFSELKVRLDGGPRASLDTPAVCGRALTTADLRSWSGPGVTPGGTPVSGIPDATPFSFFNVDLAGDELATPCPSLPFNPGFVAGTVTPNAGKFSSFTLNISRKDREQYIKGVQVKTPPGLLGMLTNVPLCPENQADDPAAYGECTASKIGTTRVASGAGSHPFEIEGDVYLTGPYEGAPFGLSIVTHVVAGPFNLGLVVVRARIDVDPKTSMLTVTTDETGPYAVPQIVFGVPLRLQRIAVNIDRPGFMFNPTNCSQQQVAANISGAPSAVVSVSSPFAVGNCKSLEFKPEFSVSASARTSRANGASLDARLAYPKNAFGNDANIARVHAELPRVLPSRLSTLNHACPDSVFNKNPANCPSESRVGYARATTPLLPVPVEGPAFFVSHGGRKFPELVVVLQGYGVTVYLEGETFISKTGVTSTTFKTVPDVPVNTFELYLPQGKYSALAANTNLCTAAQNKTNLITRKIKQRVRGKAVTRTVTRRVKSGGLMMPTEFVAQNGAVFKLNTKIAVRGCAAVNKHKSKQSRRTRRRK